MATRLPDAGRNAALDAAMDRADGGAGAGTLKIYTGSQPADADDAESGTLLVTLTLNDPAFAAASGGTKALDVSPVVTAAAGNTGTAGWFRIEDSTGVNVLDGACGEGSGELSLDNTDITSGQDVTINSLVITAAASV